MLLTAVGSNCNVALRLRSDSPVIEMPKLDLQNRRLQRTDPKALPTSGCICFEPKLPICACRAGLALLVTNRSTHRLPHPGFGRNPPGGGRLVGDARNQRLRGTQSLDLPHLNWLTSMRRPKHVDPGISPQTVFCHAGWSMPPMSALAAFGNVTKTPARAESVRPSASAVVDDFAIAVQWNDLPGAGAPTSTAIAVPAATSVPEVTLTTRACHRVLA